MATIKTKYNLGDVVYNASCYRDSYFEKCPDCDGTGKWKVEGKDLHVGYKTCNESSWQKSIAGKVRKFKYFPKVQKLTIGQIRATIGYGPEVRYMCKETGIGSGTLWYESNLTKDKELAEKCAEILAEKKNAGEEVELEDLFVWVGGSE